MRRLLKAEERGQQHRDRHECIHIHISYSFYLTFLEEVILRSCDDNFFDVRSKKVVFFVIRACSLNGTQKVCNGSLLC